MTEPSGAVEVEGQSTAIVARPAGMVTTPGANVLATMSDTEFNTLVGAMKKGQERIRRLTRELMQVDVHFGKVPGREDDPDAQFGLRKAGAEVLLKLYGYVADIKPTIQYGDPFNTESPAIRVHVRCEVHAGTIEGPIVGIGVGAANTWETKYRYRTASRVCPKCNKPALIRSKWADRDGPMQGLRPWICFEKKDGCGEKFGPEAPEIVQQVVGRVPNEDAQDLENTLVKIASKRGKVDGAINATNSSDIFTQDVEDMADGDDEAKVDAAKKTNGSKADLPASEGQIGFVRSLAKKKLGLVADAAIFAVFVEKQWCTAWPGITSKQASTIIEALKAMPDHVGAPKPGKTEAEIRAGYRKRIDDLIAKIHALKPSRQFIAESGGDGIEYIVDTESLALLGYKDFKAVDELSTDEMEKWGKWLSFQPGAAPTSPKK